MPKFTVILLICMLVFNLLSAQEDLLNLPLPENGLRYSSMEELKPRWPEKHGEGMICLWGDDKHSALSITIDDNNAPDIPFWQEMSEEFGWKFTWFVIVHPMMWDIYENQTGNNTGYFGTPAVYRELYEQGHEIGLHGSCKAMNDLEADAYRVHVQRSKAYLEKEVGNRIVTYAYPCGTTGKKEAPNIFRDVIGESMIGARGTAGGATPVHLADVLITNSMGPVSFSNPQARKRFDMLQDPTRPLKYNSYRGWPVFLYHGLNNDTKKAGVRKALEALKAMEDQFWVQPFGVVSAYWQERASGQLTVTRVEPARIIFEVTDRMRDDLFQVPLTVKFRVDGWENAAAKQGENRVKARIVTHGENRYALVDAVPDRGPVILIRQQKSTYTAP